MKKGKSTGLIVALLVGVGMYLLLNRNKPNVTPPQFQELPPRPNTKGEAFNQWVAAVIDLYGNSKKLFEPGGPFYRIPTKDIYDVVGEDPNRWDDYG